MFLLRVYPLEQNRLDLYTDISCIYRLFIEVNNIPLILDQMNKQLGLVEQKLNEAPG